MLNQFQFSQMIINYVTFVTLAIISHAEEVLNLILDFLLNHTVILINCHLIWRKSKHSPLMNVALHATLSTYFIIMSIFKA